MAPLRGWAPRGERLVGYAPFGHWNTMTFVAALRADRVSAPFILDGPINGERFRIYVQQVLVPELKAGDIVILDNLGSHKGSGDPRRHPQGRRPPVLSAEIFPRSQSDRKALRQNQALVA